MFASRQRQKYMRDLSAVTTVTEAALLWRIPARTLLYWCNVGQIVAVQPEGASTWLISVRCLLDRFGEPVALLDHCQKTRDFPHFER